MDEIFTKTALCPSSLERKSESQNSCSLDLKDFLLALVQLSAEWYRHTLQKLLISLSFSSGIPISQIQTLVVVISHPSVRDSILSGQIAAQKG